MSSTEADRSPEGGTPGETPATGSRPGDDAAAAADPPSSRPSIRPGRCWGLALLAGLIAGAASWLGGEAIYGSFIPPLLATGGFPTAEQVQAATRARHTGVTLEATTTTAMLGAALGLALGAAGGGVRGSGRTAAIAGLCGAVLGGIGGAVATQALMPVYFRFYNPDQDDLIVAMLIQGGIAAVIGAAAGAVFGAGIAGGFGAGVGVRGLVGRTIVGGLLGAAMGIVIFQVAGVMAFPLDRTTKPVSTSWGSRLFSHLAVAVLGAAGAAWGALQSPAKRKVRSAA